MADKILTAERLREVLDYDPETGVFTRKVRLAQRHHVGDRADFIVTGGGLKGYYRVSLFSKRYLAHRLAWLYVHGHWPENEIDHRDGDPSNNRIGNLRDVATAINAQNKRNARSDNKSGLLGVTTFGDGRFRASVHKDGRRVHVGMYETPEDAHAAYLKTKRKIHPGCTI